MEQNESKSQENERSYNFPVFEPVPLQPELPVPMDIAPKREKAPYKGPIVIDLADYDEM